MYVSNHQSYVDIPTIMGALRIGAFLSKDLVAYIPVIGLIAWLAGTIYFRRKDAQSRRKGLEDTLRMCEFSTPVVVFPEGTRSRDGNLRESIRLGAMRACWERDIRVGTFALDGTRFIFPPTMDRFFPNQRVAFVVGEILQPGDFPDPDRFAEASWEEVKRCFAKARVMRESPDWIHYPAL
jgi:1-acyl-sn-glycerol-3-phosphate acyltransferase